MSHQAPVITQWSTDSDGSITVNWEVDTFFEDSEPPDDVWVEINSIFYSDLGPDGRSITVPAKDLSALTGNVVVVGVSFKWSGPPDDVKQSPVVIPRADTGGGGQSSNQPAKPRLSVVSVEARTLRHLNRITIGWSSFSYTHGKITWGPVERPDMQTVPFKPKGANYQGTFSTDTSNESLRPNEMYTFRVTVTNGFIGRSESSVISVRTADNFHSVRAFLQASDASVGSLRTAFGHGGSLRSTMGI